MNCWICGRQEEQFNSNAQTPQQQEQTYKTLEKGAMGDYVQVTQSTRQSRLSPGKGKDVVVHVAKALNTIGISSDEETGSCDHAELGIPSWRVSAMRGESVATLTASGQGRVSTGMSIRWRCVPASSS